MAESLLFAKLSDDVVLCIFSKLEDDPRNWARLACVCTKFSSLILNICWKAKCYSTIPSVVADLLSSSSSCGSVPPGGWSSLHKLAFCCPGLLQAGVLLEHSDFGLERELGPDENYRLPATVPSASKTTSPPLPLPLPQPQPQPEPECTWSLYDDLYNDTVYNPSETAPEGPMGSYYENDDSNKCNIIPEDVADNSDAVRASARGGEFSVTKRRKISRSLRSHLASGVRNLSREQGNKLLASRFRGDCLYICDWPGCVHIEEKRNYMLFRGVFRNFKKSRVWRTINDGNRNKIDLNCAFCGCKQTWDLHSAFCLRRVFGYHDDGEPVVRAYVCDNGHVSGAWTDLPLYT